LPLAVVSTNCENSAGSVISPTYSSPFTVIIDVPLSATPSLAP
jgi:hypothetical protein